MDEGTSMLKFDEVDILAVAVGMVGGCVTLLQGLRAGKYLLSAVTVIAAVAVAGFAAFLVDVLLLTGVEENYKVVACGIAGMTAEKTLAYLAKRLMP